MTSSSIRKPDFLIIGAPRAGTSWVWSQLSFHPGTDLPSVKEPFFFGAAEIYRQGMDWYYALFRDKDPDKITGEGSTSNFYDRVPFFYNKGDELVHDDSLPTIPELICKELDEVKIILCLRDPVERAISHFRMFQGEGLVSPFAHLRDIAERFPKFRIVEYGYYARYLKLWRRFLPDERLCVLIFEKDIRASPEVGMGRLFDFLGLDAQVQLENSEKPVNSSAGGARGAVRYYMGTAAWRATKMRWTRDVFDWADALKSWPNSVASDDIEYLRSCYLPEREALESMLGRSIESWRYGGQRLANDGHHLAGTVCQSSDVPKQVASRERIR